MSRVVAATVCGAAALYAGSAFVQPGFQQRPESHDATRVAAFAEEVSSQTTAPEESSSSSSFAGVAFGLVLGLGMALGGADVASAGQSIGGVANIKSDPGMDAGPGMPFNGVYRYAKVGNIMLAQDMIDIPDAMEKRLLERMPKPINEGQKTYEKEYGFKVGSDGFWQTEKEAKAELGLVRPVLPGGT